MMWKVASVLADFIASSYRYQGLFKRGKHNNSAASTQRSFGMQLELSATDAISDQKIISRCILNVRAIKSTFPKKKTSDLIILE